MTILTRMTLAAHPANTSPSQTESSDSTNNALQPILPQMEAEFEVIPEAAEGTPTTPSRTSHIKTNTQNNQKHPHSNFPAGPSHPPHLLPEATCPHKAGSSPQNTRNSGPPFHPQSKPVRGRSL
ncbi:hypothetical protein BCR33DRAFT_218820 [Rhizoclosmatium globosum]|uniref:Uncharacterized protein n=1 Tax=Rhizoclosmatium globosum TaxID=329046 RepID=A0A1Y2CB72_9FUNG|nr:hypothetical protein BCR33DRAFT_218820 [Rhizoclosmatium globosum]|eukprot:ORY44301.1 hypothetical protein BCR33DRAFT_218820 [Rhizoclosmatium globosum]